MRLLWRRKESGFDRIISDSRSSYDLLIILGVATDVLSTHATTDIITEELSLTKHEQQWRQGTSQG